MNFMKKLQKTQILIIPPNGLQLIIYRKRFKIQQLNLQIKFCQFIKKQFNKQIIPFAFKIINLDFRIYSDITISILQMNTVLIQRILPLLILTLCIDATIFDKSQTGTCQICDKCTSCDQDVIRDPLIDSIHSIILQSFPSKIVSYPLSIKASVISETDVQYAFIYNTGLSIILKVNVKTGDIFVVTHENKADQTSQQSCPNCLKQTQQQSLIVNSVQQGSAGSAQQQQGQNRQTNVDSLSIFVSVSRFFLSVKQISITQSSSIQLLNSFIYRRFFSTAQFQGLSSFGRNSQLKASNLKLIYFKSYSVKYFRLIYMFLNQNAENRNQIFLEMYELIISQESSGFTIIQSSRVDSKQLSWTNTTSGHNKQILQVWLALRRQKIISSARFDIKTIDLTVFSSSSSAVSGPSVPALTVDQNRGSERKTLVKSEDQASQQYQQITYPSASQEVRQIQAYLSDYFYLTYKRLDLRKAQKEYIVRSPQTQKRQQIISYRLTYRVVKYSSSPSDEPLHYEIIVTKFIRFNGTVTYEILSALYLNLLPLQQIKSELETNTLTQAQVKLDGNIPFIDSIVLKQFTAQFGSQAPIVNIKRHQPYYQLTYLDLAQRQIKITVLYELVMNTLEFYVEGKTLANGQRTYQHLTDSAKRSQGKVQIDNQTAENNSHQFKKPTGKSQTGMEGQSSHSIPISTAKSQSVLNGSALSSVDNKIADNTLFVNSLGNNANISNSHNVKSNTLLSISKSNSSIAGTTSPQPSIVTVGSNNSVSASISSPLNPMTPFNSNGTIDSQANIRPNSPIVSNGFSFKNIPSTYLFTPSSLPQYQRVPNLDYSMFVALPNFQSQFKVSRIVEFLLLKFGQGINFFTKLAQVQVIQGSMLKSTQSTIVNSLLNGLSFYRLVFQIRRYQALSPEAIKFISGPLLYEMVFLYVQNGDKSPSIEIKSSQYVNNYCFLPSNIDLPSIIGQLSAVMTFDSSTLLSDQYYVTINQLLLSSQIDGPQGTLQYRELIKGAFAKRIGRLLPFYWVEYTNGILAIVQYNVFEKKILIVAVANLNNEALNIGNATSTNQMKTNINNTKQLNNSASINNTNISSNLNLNNSSIRNSGESLITNNTVNNTTNSTMNNTMSITVNSTINNTMNNTKNNSSINGNGKVNNSSNLNIANNEKSSNITAGSAQTVPISIKNDSLSNMTKGSNLTNSTNITNASNTTNASNITTGLDIAAGSNVNSSSFMNVSFPTDLTPKKANPNTNNVKNNILIVEESKFVEIKEDLSQADFFSPISTATTTRSNLTYNNSKFSLPSNNSGSSFNGNFVQVRQELAQVGQDFSQVSPSNSEKNGQSLSTINKNIPPKLLTQQPGLNLVRIQEQAKSFIPQKPTVNDKKYVQIREQQISQPINTVNLSLNFSTKVSTFNSPMASTLKTFQAAKQNNLNSNSSPEAYYSSEQSYVPVMPTRPHGKLISGYEISNNKINNDFEPIHIVDLVDDLHVNELENKISTGSISQSHSSQNRIGQEQINANQYVSKIIKTQANVHSSNNKAQIQSQMSTAQKDLKDIDSLSKNTITNTGSISSSISTSTNSTGSSSSTTTASSLINRPSTAKFPTQNQTSLSNAISQSANIAKLSISMNTSSLISISVSAVSTDSLDVESLIESTLSMQLSSISQNFAKNNAAITINLMSQEQFPSTMLNDFMSPYYLMFRQEYLKKRIYLNGNIPLDSKAVSGSQTRNTSLQFNLTQFTSAFLNQFAKYTYGSGSLPSILPSFQIIISHSIYRSAHRAVISSPSLKKVYEIIFISLNCYVLSFKEIQSLRQMTVGINQRQFTIEKFKTHDGKILQPKKQFQLIRNYGNMLKLVIKDVQVEQIREVTLSLVPEGFKYHISYIGSRKLLISSSRSIVKKQWFISEIIYSSQSLSLALLKHAVYKQGTNIEERNSIFLSTINSQKITEQNSISRAKLQPAQQSALKQAETILKSIFLAQTHSVSFLQIYQTTGQASSEVYILIQYESQTQPSLELIFLFNLNTQSLISVESIQFGSDLYVIRKTYSKQRQSTNSTAGYTKQIVEKARQISIKLFKNQLMAEQNVPEALSFRKIANPLDDKRQIFIFKVYFNSPVLYQVVIKIVVGKNNSEIQSLEFVGSRRLSQEVASADQFYDETNNQFSGYQNVQLLELKNDQIYKNLFANALRKYSLVRSVKILSVYFKSTIEEHIYMIVMDISSKINLLQMKVNKFDTLKFSVNLSMESSFPINGFYSRNCLRQSNKGYCIICNNQFKFNEYLLSNGKCYDSIPQCQSQLAYKCIVCAQGYILFNDRCILNDKSNLSTNLAPQILSVQNMSKSRICRTFDVKGNCVQCPQQDLHVLFQHECLPRALLISPFTNSGILSPQQLQFVNSDQFCRRWTSNICIDCIQGSVMSGTRNCQASRQNCLTYNYTVKRCDLCARSYRNVSGRCIR